MVVITPQQDVEIRRAVRDAFFVNPLISQRQLKVVLDTKFDRGFGDKYITKMVRKVHLDIRREVNELEVADRIGKYREFVRMAKDALLKIAYGERSSDKNKIGAWHTIGALEKNLLEAEFDAGIYERKIGTVGVEHHVIDETRKAAMLQAIGSTWSLNAPQPRRIEVTDTIMVESTNVPTPPTFNEPKRKSLKPEPVPVDQGPVIPGKDGSAHIVPAPVSRPRVFANSDGSVSVRGAA